MSLGYLSALLYIALTVFSILFVENKFTIMRDSSATLFLAMIIASIVFTVIGYKDAKKSYSNIIKETRSYIYVSLWVGLTWVFTIYGVAYSNGFLINLFLFLTAAVISYLLIFLKSKVKSYLIVFICGTLVLFVALLCNLHLTLGIFICFLAGLASFLYRKSSGDYAAKTNTGAIAILMTRFWPMIIIFAFFVDYHNVGYILSNHFGLLIIFSLCSLVIPTFFGQYAVNVIGAEKASMIFAFIFPFTWLGELVAKNPVASSIPSLILSVCATVIICMPYVFKKYFKL